MLWIMTREVKFVWRLAEKPTMNIHILLLSRILATQSAWSWDDRLRIKYVNIYFCITIET